MSLINVRLHANTTDPILAFNRHPSPDGCALRCIDALPVQQVERLSTADTLVRPTCTPCAVGAVSAVCALAELARVCATRLDATEASKRWFTRARVRPNQLLRILKRALRRLNASSVETQLRSFALCALAILTFRVELPCPKFTRTFANNALRAISLNDRFTAVTFVDAVAVAIFSRTFEKRPS